MHPLSCAPPLYQCSVKTRQTVVDLSGLGPWKHKGIFISEERTALDPERLSNGLGCFKWWNPAWWCMKWATLPQVFLRQSALILIKRNFILSCKGKKGCRREGVWEGRDMGFNLPLSALQSYSRLATSLSCRPKLSGNLGRSYLLWNLFIHLKSQEYNSPTLWLASVHSTNPCVFPYIRACIFTQCWLSSSPWTGLSTLACCCQGPDRKPGFKSPQLQVASPSPLPTLWTRRGLAH